MKNYLKTASFTALASIFACTSIMSMDQDIPNMHTDQSTWPYDLKNAYARVQDYWLETQKHKYVFSEILDKKRAYEDHKVRNAYQAYQDEKATAFFCHAENMYMPILAFAKKMRTDKEYAEILKEWLNALSKYKKMLAHCEYLWHEFSLKYAAFMKENGSKQSSGFYENSTPAQATTMSLADAYTTLGLPKTASPEEITQQYRKLARAYHPDVNTHKPELERKEAEKKMVALNKAYEGLTHRSRL